jgi:thiosulfate/3-mercaptopyruvate sulfurtransferase
MSSSGVRPDTTLIVYGDNNKWFAAWQYGRRKKWLSEDRDLSTDAP